MEKKQSIFRTEAIHNRLNRSLGTVKINVPVPFRLVCLFSILLLIALSSFLLFAELSEKITVKGYLDADKGIVTVHSELGGTILKSQIKEGMRVNKGDILFIISHEEHEKSKELINNLNQRINNLKAQYQLKKDHYQAMLNLYKKHYVSRSQLEQVKAELLELTNQIKLVDLEMIKYKQSVSQSIKTPVSGLITNILYKKNQTVESSNALLQIIPDGYHLISHLYVPVQDIGFLKKNTRISIHYDAYPAQRFGTYKARIKEINLNILTDNKEDKPFRIGQPYYKINAELEKSYIKVYGKKVKLHQGMTLTAIMSGEKKKIWQWIIDPIYSYYGNNS